MDAALTRQVRQRALDRCEYCQVPQECDDRRFEVDHVISRKHQGPTIAENLALRCSRCNSFKGTDVASFDPKTGKLTALFNPRRDKWARHFRWEGGRLEGRTSKGRVTVVLLRINAQIRVELREVLIDEGLFPPK